MEVESCIRVELEICVLTEVGTCARAWLEAYVLDKCAAYVLAERETRVLLWTCVLA